MLSKPQLALLSLLKQKTSDFDFSSLSPDNWSAVFEESKAQAVCLAAFDSTKNCKEYIPKEIYSDWFNTSMQLLLNNSRVETAQNRLVNILQSNGFSYIILKGLVSASYYPDPKKRILGDVDFLIDKNSQSAVETVLERHGYIKGSNDHPCHRTFENGTKHLEMHFEIAGIPDGTAGAVFKEYLKNAVSRYTVNENPAFNSPIPRIHGTIIFLHTLHHMLGEGLGLRHLCDWAYFVDKTHTQPFWEESLLPLFKKTGTLKFAAIITKTAHIYLGTICPQWAQNIPETLCEKVMEDFFAAGNLGKKDMNRSGSAKMISQHGKNGTNDSKLKNQFTTLTSSMYYLYPFLHKWKILYPVIFVWRIIRFLWLMLIGKRPNLIKANSYANKRLSLYRQFELYENTED